MIVTKLGAIDIGSNSVRCLVTNVVYKDGYTYYRKAGMVRLPIRLGQDVFEHGKIKGKTKKRFIEGMKAYAHYLKVHGVVDFRAVATSAMREASNGDKIVAQVAKETGIAIEIIGDKEEARLVFNSKIYDIIKAPQKNFVYIDVGGGSTEISVIQDKKVEASKSFRIGGVRLMNNLVHQEEWTRMERWLQKHAFSVADKTAIGAGGNINKLHKLSMRSLQTPLEYAYLSEQQELLNAFTAEERVTELGLNFDRADIIVHALPIYQKAMLWSGCDHIYVPKIGVSDGLVRDMYHKDYKAQVEL
ncbi:MAG: exopolyphosphatase [Schleiferiaceae bacterium]|jgi:exopolyphosphatase / guanosine-5'-triphosphate,3'-diphosphate pyrophosphatase|nr:exopolyphosphatase [Schleiferiaceae bacterium]MDP4759145.1 exopolyphosphatase [Schleiferiaceae bacterium]MDP4768040.1 exopolyphosphatase [Schleiferiaceae bacterium]MDP4877695.1 exopolyphosphatase [Schleiferiaceae bacterium]